MLWSNFRLENIILYSQNNFQIGILLVKNSIDAILHPHAFSMHATYLTYLMVLRRWRPIYNGSHLEPYLDRQVDWNFSIAEFQKKCTWKEHMSA